MNLKDILRKQLEEAQPPAKVEMCKNCKKKPAVKPYGGYCSAACRAKATGEDKHPLGDMLRGIPG
jgi:hypothetical protein